jgi:hypothetical protein
MSLAVRSAKRASPCAPPEGGKAVRFRSTDGKLLAGAVWGSGSVGIVAAHDADSRLCEWSRAARFLSRHGFRVLLFDYRTNPFLSESGSYPVGTFRFDHDIAGGVSFLRGLGSKEIVLGGDGVGGLAALVAAKELGNAVSGVFTLTAGGIKGTTDSLGDRAQPDDLDALAAVKQLPAPALFLGAASDTNVRALYRASVSSSKRWLVLPQSALRVNGFGMSAWSAKAGWARLARKKVISFIRGHVRHS